MGCETVRPPSRKLIFQNKLRHYFDAYLKLGVIHEYQIKSFGSAPINRGTCLNRAYKHSMETRESDLSK